MDAKSVISLFEASLSNALNGQAFIEADSLERPFILIAYLGRVNIQLRNAEILYAQSPSTQLIDCINEIKALIREVTPKACQLVLASMETESHAVFFGKGQRWRRVVYLWR